MKKLLISGLIIFFSFFAHANEQISKLNQLYLNGVLDKSSYIDALDGLGINTSNDIFINLFDLFSDKTLDVKAYENSLNNLISLSNQTKSETNLPTKKKSSESDDKSVKIYKIFNCKGNSELCGDLEPIEFQFYYDNNQVILDKKSIQSEIDNDTSLQRIMMSKNFSKDDTFDHIITIRHTRGFLLDFKFGGYIEGNEFFLTNLSIRANGNEVSSSDLVVI